MIIALQTLIYFRESLLIILDRLIGPYYKRFSFSLIKKGSSSDDEDSDEQVFSEFDDEKGVIFFPPMYVQRYAAVNDCLLDERWSGKLEKIVDLGYHDMTFIKYLKEVPGVKHILGVDIENVSLRCSPDIICDGEYAPIRETPLQITLFEGNAADPDYRLIGCDAVIAIEMIEHMLPHDLDRLVHNIFGFIQPQVVIITTPNADFNVLFKSMEKNGLRRWDHLFEWSREQFNDWCSNIVTRYPNYTVTCKGVGPGPPGTQHYGCCTQLALFLSKNYQKQQSLTIDSMALVKSLPNDNNLSDIESWDYPDSIHESNMLCAPPNDESFTEIPFPDKRSCMTIVILSSPPIDTLVYKDNMSQCNIDREVGRSYLMFDEDVSENVVVPRRKVINRVYEIEDVSSRLHCSMLQVRKFSKTTQNLMAKNKLDSIMHTREIVDEIRQLTKTLNLNRNTLEQQHKVCTWNNFNWGENAPYWNQYYRVVRDYNYPYEIKSEESRIIELISDEINELVDSQISSEGSMNSEKLEIPLEYLMHAVEHITNDMEKVKDLLEWNGYEVVDNIVIHSRLIVENVSMATPENDYQDDAFSDWDMTEMHSTSYSIASSNSSHPNGKWIQRSLDFKVRKLRNLLTADEDISTELDRVVCRLMKLAITTQKNKSIPPPTSWLQCKLLDLLTLTERAIQRRKKYCFSQNPSFTFGVGESENSINFSNSLAPSIVQDAALNNFRYICKGDDQISHACNSATRIDFWRLKRLKTAKTYNNQTNRTRELEPPKSNDIDSTKEIVAEYSHFVGTTETDKKEYYNNTTVGAYEYVHLEVEDDDMSVTSNELVKVYDYNNQECSASPSYDKLKTNDSNARDHSPARTYPITDNYSGVSSSGDTDHSIKLSTDSRSKKSSRKSRRETNKEKHKIKLLIKKSKKSNRKESKPNEKHADSTEKKIYFKRTIKKKSFCKCTVKNSVSSAECERNKVVNKRKSRQNPQMSSISKPIPYSLMDLCTSKDDETEKPVDDFIPVVSNNSEHFLPRNQESIAITEQSCVIEIVTRKTSETLALHRTITTDLSDSIYKNNSLPLEFNDTLSIVPIITKSESSIPDFTLKTENEESQAIFLYDINEPSTSKGIRHVTMDVQCGPDTGFVCPYSSATSLNKITNENTNTTDLKSYIDECEQSHFYTKPEENKDVKIDNLISSRHKSNGIQIKDSDNEINEKLELSSTTVTKSVHNIKAVNDSDENIGTTSINVVTSLCKIDDEVPNITKQEDPIPQVPQKIISNVYAIEDDQSKRTSDYLEPIIDIPTAINNTRTEQFLRKEIDLKNSICKIGNRKLAYGGIFIHSYKEKTACEDVLYQGKWQHSFSKSFIKKNPVSTFTVKKITESHHNIKRRNSKLGLTAKTNGKTNEHNRSSKKIRKLTDLLEPKKDISVSSNEKIRPKKKPSVELCKPTRRCKTLREVASKTVRFDLSKNTRFERVTVKASKSKIYQNGTKDKKKVTFKESHSKCDLNTRNKLLKAMNYSVENGKNDIPKNLSSTMNIKKELMKFVREPHENIVYSVFRNKIENETDNQRHSKPSLDNRKNKEHKSTRNIPIANSSSSSTNSIVTIRQLSPPSQNKKKFTSKITLKVSNIPKASSMKEKLSIPECYKKSSVMFDDKENNPQSSNVSNVQCNKDNTQTVNERSKSILMSRNTISKQKNKTLSIKKSIENIEEKLGTSDSSSSSKVSLVESIKNQINFNANSSNLVLVLGSCKKLPTMESEKLSPDICLSANNQEIVPLTSIIELTCENNERNVSSSTSEVTVYHEMKSVVDEILNFIDDPRETSILTSESKILIPDDRKKSGEKVHFYNALDNESIVTSFDSGPRQVNLDLISFKSFASLSGYSEYFLADSELSTTIDSLQVKTPSKRSSVQDIFERNDQTRLSFPGDSVQGFSGFSINEQVIGDQPDYANLINPETGSMSHVMETRRATSEEVFTSGRSSDTYESCQVDEDALVPHWLFHAISQQQSDEDREPQRILSPIPLPTVEPDLDIHANAIEPGVGGAGGAGAGDGRGIHSDQDSSGRDTSMSSTETSSGQQSDAILIDPSAYANNIEFLREPSSRPFLQLESTESPDSSFRTVEGSENDNAFNMSEVSTRNNLNLGAVQSDRDADVSSLDTDTADFSDN